MRTEQYTTRRHTGPRAFLESLQEQDLTHKERHKYHQDEREARERETGLCREISTETTEKLKEPTWLV